ncbi:equilibrative nucleobase transporter 1-like [Halichoeres trimaculatus]|uniref:equilibrative nucleobase transporter 1-like n=1 Tax=Halichoeres trimaculatus TaxID=147232 RepID=UPI003D9F60C9
MFVFRGRPKPHYFLTLLSGLVESLFFSGVAYGWASLVFVLKADGYFAAYCVNSTSGNDYVVQTGTVMQSGNHSRTYTRDCTGQDEQFSLVMCVALISNTVIRFPVGYVFDRFGTTATRLISILLYTTGTLLITLLSEETALFLYPAMTCIMISGMILHTTNVQVGNLFHFYRSTIITVYNGAFDSSAVVFLIVKVLHERGVSLYWSFFFLTSCTIIPLLRTVLLMPRGHIPYPLPDTYTYGVRCSRGREEDNNMKKNVTDQKEDRKDTEEVATFRSCVISWLFLWHLVWVVIILFCQFIFLSNVNSMLSRLANNDQTVVSHYTNAFALTQLCSVLFAPVNGLIMDRNRKKPLALGETRREADLHSSCLSLFLTALQCFLLCVCFTCPVLHLQYFTFILQVINSSFFYGSHQAFISMAFPMSHFGKMSGIAMSLSAVGLLFQVPILHLVQHQLHGNPLYVNIGVTFLSLFAFIHPIHVKLYCRKLAKQRPEKTQKTVKATSVL